MARRLRNVLRVTGLAPGARVTIAHLLYDDDGSLVPDEIELTGNLSYVDADAAFITVENTGAADETGTVCVGSVVPPARAVKPTYIKAGLGGGSTSMYDFGTRGVALTG